MKKILFFIVLFFPFNSLNAFEIIGCETDILDLPYKSEITGITYFYENNYFYKEENAKKELANFESMCFEGEKTKIKVFVDGKKYLEKETTTKDSIIYPRSSKNIFGDIITVIDAADYGNVLSYSDSKINGLYFNGKKIIEKDLFNNFSEIFYYNKKDIISLTEYEKLAITKLIKEKYDKSVFDKIEKLLDNYKDIYNLDEIKTREFLVLAYAYLIQFR